MTAKVIEQSKKQTENIYTATLRYARISPRKVNYVAELIRGLSTNRALEVLMFNPRRASYFLYKLLRSAISNAIKKSPKVDVDRLYIKEIKVNGGPMLKRLGSAPRGRAVLIRRRFSHVTIILAEMQEQIREKKTKAQERPHKPEQQVESQGQQTTKIEEQK
ncbi:MAG: 50S ribosomal protein L22 [Planctomycetota bacterium]